jgi:hypothetical protein
VRGSEENGSLVTKGGMSRVWDEVKENRKGGRNGTRG